MIVAVVFWGLLGLVAAGAIGAEKPSATDAGKPPALDDAQDLVFFSPQTPMVIRVHLQVNGKGFRSIQVGRAERLMDSLDLNDDGVLDRQESQLIPTPERITPAPQIREITFEGIDRSPTDGQISLQELSAYVDRVTGEPFAIAVKPPRSSQAVPLFSRLDGNQDGQVSESEVRAGRESLRKFDLDNDGAFHVQELLPFRGPARPGVPAAVGRADPRELPFAPIPRKGSLEAVIEKVFERYDNVEDERGDGFLSRDELGLDAALFARFDRNRDGKLDAEEIGVFLRNPAPQIEIFVEMPGLSFTRPRISVKSPPGFPPVDVRQEHSRRLELELAGIPFEMRVNLPVGTATDNLNFYKLRFRVADADKNGYLSEQEFPAANVPNANFRVVDRNNDGMILVKEVEDYIKQETEVSQSLVYMLVSREGASLFELLDADSDRRLTPRELQEGFARLRSVDRTGDRRIASTEIDSLYQLTFEMGKPPLFSEEMMQATAANREMQAQPMTVSRSGPRWFQNMDRNGDGDVTEREFLGTAEMFRQIDRDHDRLISADEADLIE